MNFHKDIRGYLWLHVDMKTKAFRSKLSIIGFYILCFLKNIKTGKGNIIVGMPSLKRHPLSTFSIGNNCTLNSWFSSMPLALYKKCHIMTSGKKAVLTIGNEVGLSAVTIIAAQSIIIEDNVMVGAHSTIMDTDFHGIDLTSRMTGRETLDNKPVHIRKGAWIGMNVTILKGVTIGENTVIGANSVVTKSIPANVIAAGNPCRVIKEV